MKYILNLNYKKQVNTFLARNAAITDHKEMKYILNLNYKKQVITKFGLEMPQSQITKRRNIF